MFSHNRQNDFRCNKTFKGCILLAALATFSLTGCQLWPGAHESVASEKAEREQSSDSELDLNAASKFRPKNPKSKPYFFFDDRASQVEKNLGY